MLYFRSVESCLVKCPDSEQKHSVPLNNITQFFESTSRKISANRASTLVEGSILQMDQTF